MGEAGAWSYIIISFFATLGLLFASILFFSKNTSLTSKSLAGVLLSYSIIGISYGLVSTNFFIKYPQFWRLPLPFSFLLPVFSYKYVESVIKQHYRFSSWDLLYIFPAILYCFNFYPFLVLSADDKSRLISVMIENKKMISQEVDGILPKGLGINLRLVYGLFFSLAQFFHLFRYKKRNLLNENLILQNQDMYRWLIYFSSVVLSSYVMMLIWSALQMNSSNDIFVLMTFTIGGSICFFCAYLIAKPNILYGLAGWADQSLPDFEVMPDSLLPDIKTKDAEKVLVFTTEQRLNYTTLIDDHLSTKHPFVRAGYKIKDLSNEIGLPVYIISAFINQAYGKNFSELINDYRVDYLSKVLNTSPESDNLTLDALSRSAGFNSRTSFIAAVKKKTGKTPSDFFFNPEQN